MGEIEESWCCPEPGYIQIRRAIRISLKSRWGHPRRTFSHWEPLTQWEKREPSPGQARRPCSALSAAWVDISEHGILDASMEPSKQSQRVKGKRSKVSGKDRARRTETESDIRLCPCHLARCARVSEKD